MGLNLRGKEEERKEKEEEIAANLELAKKRKLFLSLLLPVPVLPPTLQAKMISQVSEAKFSRIITYEGFCPKYVWGKSCLKPGSNSFGVVVIDE